MVGQNEYQFTGQHIRLLVVQIALAVNQFLVKPIRVGDIWLSVQKLGSRHGVGVFQWAPRQRRIAA